MPGRNLWMTPNRNIPSLTPEPPSYPLISPSLFLIDWANFFMDATGFY
jgi:hypothetical protein